MILNERQLQVITGSLLGDGCLSKRYSGQNSLFSERHCAAQFEYLNWKSKELGLFSNGKFYEETRSFDTKNPSSGKKTSFKLESVRHKVFSDLEKIWYLRDSNSNYILESKNKRRIKILPNIKLTPLIVAVWYFDDGYNVSQRRSCYLCTDNFKWEEVEKLIVLLKELNIIGSINKTKRGHPNIRITSESYISFINMVSPYCPDCMSYKIDLSNYKATEFTKSGIGHQQSKLNEESINLIYKYRKLNFTQKKIGELIGVSGTTICRFLDGTYYKNYERKIWENTDSV